MRNYTINQPIYSVQVLRSMAEVHRVIEREAETKTDYLNETGKTTFCGYTQPGRSVA